MLNLRHSWVPSIPPSAGLARGHQNFVLDRNDMRNNKIFQAPDSTPWMKLEEIFDIRGLLKPDLWKFACFECIASMINVFITAWVSLHPPAAVEAPKTEAGIYHTLTFFSPLYGGITNLLLTPLLIRTLFYSSGGYINPTVTFAAFCARNISFPCATLYLAGQTFGGALAGFAIQTAYGSRKFTVGGCHVDSSLVSVKSALMIEFFSCLIFIIPTFSEILDPRQPRIFRYSTAPWFVGIMLGVVTWGSAFTLPGYIGASLNPARCFGVYVASEFPGYHWIHWVGPLAAAIAHGIVCFVDSLGNDPRIDS